ncbi:MAG: hypothetical protein IGR92_05470 [Leptolyngbyaceae cyanobacterium T60_A2020_046]|nr:hypothetical protein [Leptolyngbyaceae cyanobacterium T60_A2020_046]
MSESSPRFDPSSVDTSPAPEAQLAAGLDALQQRSYADAIATLSTLQHRPGLPKTIQVKATMGLVRAYAKQGQTTEAIHHCRSLSQSSSTQVRQWAQKMLTQLTAVQAFPAPSAKPSTGFQPLAPEATGAVQNASGFVPLEPASSPLETTPPSKKAQDPPQESLTLKSPRDRASSPEPMPQPPPEESPAGEASPQANEAETPALSSLFHDEQLNATVADSAPVEDIKDSAGDSPNSAIAPAPHSPPESESTEPAPADLLTAAEFWAFRNQGRLPRPRAFALPAVTIAGLGVLQLGSAIALFWVIQRLVHSGLSALGWLIVRQPLLPLPYPGMLYGDYRWPIALSLMGLLLASPWLLDILLARAYGQTPLSVNTLKTTHPETVRLLRQLSQRRGALIPSLKVLPTQAPVVLSYGWLPQVQRLVVSRGVLDRLEDDELATLVAYDWAHSTTGTLPLMSGMGALLQLVYQVYWQGAAWGDRRRAGGLRAIAATISALAYSLYWLLHKVTITLARVRVPLSDRYAAAWTGNPNALVRALLKFAIATAEDVSHSGHTHPAIESLDVLMPLGHTSALTPGSLYGQADLLQVLSWERHNPYRHWLTVNNAHPLLGDRLLTLSRLAHQWGLEPEMPLPETVTARHRSQLRLFLLQISPYLGPAVGAAFALLLWFLGGIATPFGIWQLGAFYGDPMVLRGAVLLGTGMGIFIRINRYFPDIPPAHLFREVPLLALLQNPQTLPSSSTPVRLKGTLLGRRGIANWMGQDLILQTSTGLVKLHFLSILGAVGNLLTHPAHPANAVGQPLAIAGWFRRGATPWIDVEVMARSGKTLARSNHPLLAVLLGVFFCAWGMMVLLRG